MERRFPLSWSTGCSWVCVSITPHSVYRGSPNFLSCGPDHWTPDSWEVGLDPAPPPAAPTTCHYHHPPCYCYHLCCCCSSQLASDDDEEEWLSHLRPQPWPLAPPTAVAHRSISSTWWALGEAEEERQSHLWPHCGSLASVGSPDCLFHPPKLLAPAAHCHHPLPLPRQAGETGVVWGTVVYIIT